MFILSGSAHRKTQVIFIICQTFQLKVLVVQKYCKLYSYLISLRKTFMVSSILYTNMLKYVRFCKEMHRLPWCQFISLFTAKYCQLRSLKRYKTGRITNKYSECRIRNQISSQLFNTDSKMIVFFVRLSIFFETSSDAHFSHY